MVTSGVSYSIIGGLRDDSAVTVRIAFRVKQVTVADITGKLLNTLQV